MPKKAAAASAPAVNERDGIALIRCLEYLGSVAQTSGFVLSAHMIGLAMDATAEAIDSLRTSKGGRAVAMKSHRGKAVSLAGQRAKA